jgi:hypothetical protein
MAEDQGANRRQQRLAQRQQQASLELSGQVAQGQGQWAGNLAATHPPQQNQQAVFPAQAVGRLEPQPGPPRGPDGLAPTYQQQGLLTGDVPVARPRIDQFGPQYGAFAAPTHATFTLQPSAAAAFRSEQGPVPPPLLPHTAAPGARATPRSATVYEESIATGAFRRLGAAGGHREKSERDHADQSSDAALAGSAVGAGAVAEAIEAREPLSPQSSALLAVLRGLLRGSQAVLLGLLIGFAVFTAQYNSDSEVLSAWALHAGWARIGTFVLSVLSWLGASEQFSVWRSAVKADRWAAAVASTDGSASNDPARKRVRVQPHTANSRASWRAAALACASYTILLATVFATMPGDQRIAAASLAIKGGAAPSDQLLSDIKSWRALLAVRLTCAALGWIASAWDVRGPQEVDLAVGEAMHAAALRHKMAEQSVTDSALAEAAEVSRAMRQQLLLEERAAAAPVSSTA